MGRLSTAYWQMLYRNDNSMSLRWAMTLCAGLALMPTFGSAVSVGFICATLMAWFLLIAHRDRFAPMTSEERLCGWISLAYAGIALAAALAGANFSKALPATASYFGFLLALPLLPVLRYLQDWYWERWIAIAIAAGGIISGLWAATEVLWFRQVRAEALTGNPLIFAYLAGIWGLMNGWLALNVKTWQRGVHLFAACLGFVAILLSASRAPLVIYSATAACGLVWWLLLNRPAAPRRIVFGAVSVVGALVAAYLVLAEVSAFQRVIMRLEARFDVAFGILSFSDGYADSNLDTRSAMLTGGLEAFRQSPLLGYGRQNVMDVASRFHDGKAFPFTHLHNAYLTEAVASGFLGVAAFIAVLCMPLVIFRRRLPPSGLAAVVVAFTALYSATNIGFSHDIKLFSYGIVMLALAVLANRGHEIYPTQERDYSTFLANRHGLDGDPAPHTKAVPSKLRLKGVAPTLRNWSIFRNI
jgi:O-antigen ligase